MNPGETEVDNLRLCHCHAHDWADWVARYRYRHAKGSYRADLKPADGADLTLHDLLTRIEAEAGEPGLRAFFDEVCADTPALRTRLQEAGLLLSHELDLDAARRQQFGC